MKKIVGYYGSWAVYREGDEKVTILDINPHLCTHLIYSFVDITRNGNITINDSNDKEQFKKFNDLRNRNSSLKTMVAIGGWESGSANFSEVANDSSTRSEFVSNAVRFVQRYGFDGLDLDWEYPGLRDGRRADKGAFVKLVEELSSEFDDRGLYLSAAVGAQPDMLNTSYDVRKLSKYLDFINLMTYDYHTDGDRTGHNSPMDPNVKETVESWINAGAARSKLNLGIPFYGRHFTLKSSRSHGVGARSTCAKMLGYNQIQALKDEGGWNFEWDDDSDAQYAYRGNEWLSYDSPNSVRTKADYILEEQLGGAMIWSVDTDVVRGTSRRERYPLLREINEKFEGAESRLAPAIPCPLL